MDTHLWPEDWTLAYDADDEVPDGAWSSRPPASPICSAGRRDAVDGQKKRPYPGAQLRFTDRDGFRLTAFVTNTTKGQLPDLELRHRRRARCEDCIRAAKDTGLRNLPFRDFDANRI